MKIKKTLRNALIIGSLVAPFVPLAIRNYSSADEVAEKVENLDELPGISKEDVETYRDASVGLRSFRNVLYMGKEINNFPIYIRELDYCKYPLTKFQFREHLIRNLSCKEMKQIGHRLKE